MHWPSNASAPSSLSLVCSIGAELLSQYPLITEAVGIGVRSLEDSSLVPFGMWHRHGMKRYLLGGAVRHALTQKMPFSKWLWRPCGLEKRRRKKENSSCAVRQVALRRGAGEVSPVGCRSAIQKLEDAVGALGADVLSFGTAVWKLVLLSCCRKLGKLRRLTVASSAPNHLRIPKAYAESLGGCEDIARAE
ncbi:unnamed protein product [Prunus armeniaca]|uniref:Uncharacterized protein n=1 Tax=Prunus armeniaca TaxID=36596 RepID=A0A6J5VW43_PRUAR|nr:unnamed protein product [Prunus armeniaca]